MASPKRLTDLIDYAAILPYASELFGIYQPLLGWRSKRIAGRFDRGFARDKQKILGRLKRLFAGQVDVAYKGSNVEGVRIRTGLLDARGRKASDSVLLEELGKLLPPNAEAATKKKLGALITAESIRTLFEKTVAPRYLEYHKERLRADAVGGPGVPGGARPPDLSEHARAQAKAAFESQLRHESSLAGALLYLADRQDYLALKQVFYSARDNTSAAQTLIGLLQAADPVEGYMDLSNLNPRDREELARVALSPISVVHLFRQYFFELDSFLGTPVGHVWLSPGSTVELIEVQTRRTIVEKTLEQSVETTLKSETETTDQEEISEAVKEDNKQDVKFGASVSASYASIVANSSFDYSTSQQQSREETHKRMRQQTEKLSSEIRKNYKSTFKTVTETTDTSSKRYVLTNTTEKLLNYELRRKMRQVAVQVQDIGSYLCWQTYVDNPGASLGVAKLLHIAKPAELDGLHAPDEIPMLQPFTETKDVTIPFVSIEDTDADNEDEVYEDGIEVDDSEWGGNLEKIKADFPVECVCSRGNYVLENVEFDGMGKPVRASRRGDITNADNRASFMLHLDSADFQGQNSVQVRLTLHWSPGSGANDEAIQKNKDNTESFKAKEANEYQKAYLENARQRVKLLHQIRPRPSEDLREEERIVVYRKLIQEMLTSGVDMPDDRSRHVVAELINSIFDVDKMLYFVAPEWWRPRLRDHRQQLEPTTSPPITVISNLDSLAKGYAKKLLSVRTAAEADKLASSTVGWGDVDDPARANYFITEDSEPARFGSSLGWLLQLDGDNMRNAFLNAPWVKAVIPIRPGKEEAAIAWLEGVEGFNGIGPADVYQSGNPAEKDINGQPLNGQKMIDVIVDLARKIQRKHREGIERGVFPKASEVSDPQLVDAENVVTATPIDRVYEHGFFPLEGGFRANVSANYEIFDQWLEILPTDQVVPVEVSYNPKTGRQV